MSYATVFGGGFFLLLSSGLLLALWLVRDGRKGKGCWDTFFIFPVRWIFLGEGIGVRGGLIEQFNY